PLIVADDAYLVAIGPGRRTVTTVEFLRRCAEPPAAEPVPFVDDDAVAVQLFTSGTTSAPKCVLLRHRNLTSYVLQTVEFASAAEIDAALVSVPPYHIAGVGTILTNLYSGKRVHHLPDFTAERWLETVEVERITSAMVVPTMLSRIVDVLETAGNVTPTTSLRAIAYGGAPMPRPVLERALRHFPDVDFTNAYGLTETSSTISVLTPEDHRSALASDHETVRSRLESVGRMVPGVEALIRDDSGAGLPTGEVGELWVRGAQVSGEYAGKGSVLDADGWFPTRDRAHLDADGYLFVHGRADDTIIRGGENISPAEVENVVIEHPEVRDVAVFGAPDDEWGHCIVAVVVRESGSALTGDELTAWTRARVRSSRSPDRIVFGDELPYSPTGKLLRNDLAGSVLSNRPV
ncbi:class I adenylate-forming enzyme family protein, partial [Gordonia terrae]